MRSLVSRLKRLERVERKLIRPRVVIQNGHMKTLPAEYKGERHVVTLSRVLDANGREWFEWEERPGPAPVAEVATAPHSGVSRPERPQQIGQRDG